MYRCAAAPSFRRSPFSLQVTEESRKLMEQWSLGNPQEGVMGLAAAIESRLLARHMPSVFWPAELIFMGYMPNGQQLRVAWFKHATVNPTARAPPRLWSGTRREWLRLFCFDEFIGRRVKYFKQTVGDSEARTVKRQFL